MEVAAYLSDKAASVSSIDITAVPFERVLGADVGRMLQSVGFLSPSLSPLTLLLRFHNRCTKRTESSFTSVLG